MARDLLSAGEQSANKKLIVMTYQSPHVAHNHLYWWTRVGSSGPPTWRWWCWLKDRSEVRLSVARRWIRRIKSNPNRAGEGDASPSSRILQRSCHSQSLTPALAAPPTAFLPSKCGPLKRWWSFEIGSACQNGLEEEDLRLMMTLHVVIGWTREELLLLVNPNRI